MLSNLKYFRLKNNLQHKDLSKDSPLQFRQIEELETDRRSIERLALVEAIQVAKNLGVDVEMLSDFHTRKNCRKQIEDMTGVVLNDEQIAIYVKQFDDPNECTYTICEKIIDNLKNGSLKIEKRDDAIICTCGDKEFDLTAEKLPNYKFLL